MVYKTCTQTPRFDRLSGLASSGRFLHFRCVSFRFPSVRPSFSCRFRVEKSLFGGAAHKKETEDVKVVGEKTVSV